MTGINESEFNEAMRDISAVSNAVGDQARAMTNQELGRLLLSGKWSTIEVHEAGRRLIRTYDDHGAVT
jgi:uncharacterized protein (UPF0297 family)